MTPNDQSQFIRLLRTLAEVYDRKLTDGVVELYLSVLRDLSIEQLTRACDVASRECKFFPKPVELRELVQDSATERAERAWWSLPLR